jgi:O-antigen chain-terminating methyltransferase
LSIDARPLEDLIERLERERLEADRLYNAALTAVDRAIQVTPALPAPPRPYDPSRLPHINRTWQILPVGPPPIDRSLKGRLRGLVWRLIGPPLETQQQFNAAVADHLNRNVEAELEGTRGVAALLQTVRRELEALARFESLLIQYLQTITAYVDTKDRSLGGTEFRQRLALAEQRILALKRDLEERPSAAPPASATAAGGLAEPFSASLDSAAYVEFEDRFRGSQHDVRERVKEYLPILSTASGVLDIGCGRGELLTLLKEQGVTARGIDVNRAMVEVCRAQGLDAEHADALEYLACQPDQQLGGLIAIQVVEHFEPAYLMRFLETAFHKMRDGAPIVLETINPACWMAFFETYIRDLTHRRPLHPETLRYLVEASGFSKIDIHFRRPVAEADRLDRVALTSPAGADLANLANTVNANAEKLNARLFSSMDYVVIARR